MTVWQVVEPDKLRKNLSRGMDSSSSLTHAHGLVAARAKTGGFGHQKNVWTVSRAATGLSMLPLACKKALH
eukprot:3758519-Pleurochrysis_carterae.AAC.6